MLRTSTGIGSAGLLGTGTGAAEEDDVDPDMVVVEVVYGFVLLPVLNPRSYDGARIVFFGGFGPSYASHRDAADRVVGSGATWATLLQLGTRERERERERETVYRSTRAQ